jgi:nucleotide-binding universal stress UspA family protein
MPIESVVVAVGRGDDGDARTARLAHAIVDLAESADPEIVLLCVFARDELEELIEQLDFADPGDADADAVARRRSATRRLGDRIEAAGVGYSVRGEVDDDPAAGIVEVADQLGADRILVGGRDRTPAGKAVFGSVAQQVLLTADCPVTYVRAD